tara:strand:- start:225668 stop:227566 length:1899 start_codon:yes stop_codon:yes gene_type:complete
MMRDHAQVTMMDNLRGQDDIGGDEAFDYSAIEAPPAIDTNERRMHVRAYNYWVSLLGNRVLPSIEDLNPEEMEDFSANSVLLDFSMGLENPAILYLGSALREECGITGTVERVDEVPSRSLLSRLTDHYLQIIANAAPVGFEAEFTNQRDAEIMYRGILMPFSSDDETIDFIYGVISWKEVASKSMIDGLDEEMKAAMSTPPPSSAPAPIWADGPSATADFEDDESEDMSSFESIGELEADDFGFTDAAAPTPAPTASEDIFDLDVESMLEIELDTAVDHDEELDLSAFIVAESGEAEADTRAGSDETASGETPADAASPEAAETEHEPFDLDAAMEADSDNLAAAASMHVEDYETPDPAIDSLDTDMLPEAFGPETFGLDEETVSETPAAPEEEAEEAADDYGAALSSAMSIVGAHEPMPDITDVLDPAETAGGLVGALDIARQSAAEARDAAARSRVALYRAIGHAHDFALATRDAPADYQALLEQAGITVQERSPMTAIVKLVFGVDYDKTRIAEYALALDYALIHGLPPGSLAGKLGFYEGGLKGLVRDMRATRHGGELSRPAQRLERAYRKIGKARRLDAGALAFDEHGVALIVARREADGSVSFVASVDTQDKAAQKLLITASKAI